MWSLCLAVSVQLLLCSGWVKPVESQSGTVSPQVRHSLIPNRLQSLYGSDINGSCTDVMGGRTACRGMSVLNDGVIPVLSGVNNDSESQWAAQLFTLRRPTGDNGRIVASFELEDANHDRVELAVFNCPELGISAPEVNVYFDSSFRSGREDRGLGVSNINVSLTDTSCDQLTIFCVKYNSGSSRYINLVFPFPSTNVNSTFVFLGEVKFLNSSSAPCLGAPPTTSPTGSNTTSPSSTSDSAVVIVVVIVVVLLLLLVLVAAMVIVVIFLCFRVHRRKEESSKVQRLQSVVLESKDEEEKEAETFIDGLNNYECVDKPPQNGFQVADNAAIIDVLYSEPDDVRNDTYSHLRDGEKNQLSVWNETAANEQYSKLNRSQTDPVGVTRRSPTPQEPLNGEGIMYAVPDSNKKRSKKKTANAPAIPRKSAELVEYLDTKFSHSEQLTASDSHLPEYSEIGSGNRRSGSVGPVPLSKPASLSMVSSLNSNPIYQPTDIMPARSSAVPQPQYGNGVLQTDAIYSEPLAQNEHEPEWNPDQNIYESIYSEPLKPSLFMQETDEANTEELRPYSSIYSPPLVQSSDKPLSVSVGNIKEIKRLGDGNFGEVVLAQTVGLSPRDLKLEGEAPYTLVAVKKLKQNASERNRDLFEKEVKFMSKLNHPNVIRLLAVCSDEAAPFIMMEYMKNGDLNQYLKGFHSIGNGTYDNVKPIDLSTLIYMCTQVASAMQYLASQNFVHRDLATRNCLVGSKHTIKISDFGMSRSLYESSYYVISGHAILPIRWMATECFYGKFSAKTDVWAFGVTMWEIFTLAKDQPYSGYDDREVVEDAVKGPDRMQLERPARCPEDIYQIMRKCWFYEPSQRPTFDELYTLLSNS